MWPRTGVGTIAGGSVAGGDATYMRWGTKEVLKDFPYYIVTRIRQSRKKETLQYENGDGVQSGRMQIFHGMTWEVTVRDRYDYAAPVEGTLVYIADMAGLVNATFGTGAVPGTANATQYQARVIDSDYNAAPKQPGERVLMLERITLIEG